MNVKRQAVIVIHGIGEQRPMDTLRGVVEAVWRTDPKISHDYGVDTVWSKPEFVSGTLELRRLSTGRNRAEIETDFFEFYWQHLMKGTRLSHVWAWLQMLLLRWPWQVPRALFGVWVLLIGLAALAGFVAYALSRPEDHPYALSGWGAGLLTLVVIPVLTYVLRRVVGDAARYLYTDSENIESRRAIRQAGINLLRDLHDRKASDGTSPRYDRFIIVGHSLGSVIAYDVITQAWARTHKAVKEKPQRVVQRSLDALEGLPRDEWIAEDIQPMQRRLHDEYAGLGLPWRVTDLVTVGSPLAHASVLMADDQADLDRRIAERELPACPPVFEVSKGQPFISFPRNGSSKHEQAPNDPRKLHHAAVFAATRWTNIYAPAFLVVFGDVIGGPLAPVFGSGIRDLRVRTSSRFRLLEHTKYWSIRRSQRKGHETVASLSVQALREAIDLADEGGGA